MKSRRVIRFGKLIALGLGLTLAGLSASVYAESGPTPTPTASAKDGGAQVYVQAPTDSQIKAGGEDIQVTVLASGVSNLAGFQFSLQYNASVLEYKSLENGALLSGAPRGADIYCSDPVTEHNGKTGVVRLNCVTTGPPVSLGGKHGADGSGSLAQATFSPIGGGDASLDLTDVILVAAEVDATGVPVQMPASTQGAALNVIGSGSSSPWLIIVGAIAAAVIVVGGGLILLRRARRSI